MADYGIAWLDADERELGFSGGVDNLEDALREAKAGLLHAYPRASHAVVFTGRSLAEGEVVRTVERS